MAKAQDKKKRKDKNKSKSSKSQPNTTPSTPVALLAQATEFLQQGQPDLALSPAQAALSALRNANGTSSPLGLPALSLVAEIQLDLGDVESATQSFVAAAQIDPDGAIPESQGGGADKFLNLAQLDATGGQQSLQWFEKAITCLEREVSELDTKLETSRDDAAGTAERDEKRAKLAHALCATCELYMTDLSFDPDAEAHCERLITQAMMLTSEDPQTLVTLASIRLSQQRVEDAREALTRSLGLWGELPAGHPGVPEFAARIALARALMEAGMEGAALEVCERLVGEDDGSVEAWYLGGWCMHLYAQNDGDDDDDDEEMDEGEKANEKQKEPEDGSSLTPEDKQNLRLSSREWLRNCLKLCQALDYEDDRLRDHARELVEELDRELGDAELDDEDEWEGIESGDEGEGEDGDQEMDES